MPRRAFGAISGTRWRERAILRLETQGIRRDGDWLPGGPLETSVQVITSPASAGLARSILPEGARITEARTFWLDAAAVQPLRVGIQQSDADEIVYRGLVYRVRHVNDYAEDGFVECLATREDGQADQSPHN